MGGKSQSAGSARGGSAVGGTSNAGSTDIGGAPAGGVSIDSGGTSNAGSTDIGGAPAGGVSTDSGGSVGAGTAGISGAGGSAGNGAAGGPVIDWRAFLPLTSVVSNEAGGGTTPDVTGHLYDATYSAGLAMLSNGMTFTGNPRMFIPPQDITPVVDLTRSYSISVWVTLWNNSGWRTFVSANGAIISEFYLQKRLDTGTFSFTLTTSDINSAATGWVCMATSTFNTVIYTLYHLVATRDASTGVDILYVNGAEAGRATCTVDTGVAWPANTIGVGYGMYDSQKVDAFEGILAGLGFIDRVLMPEEVSALYAAGSAYSP